MSNKPPRIPGSQVAPGQRPFVAGGVTASTHSMVPLAQATAGKTYRVRCKDYANVWGTGLAWDDAVKLKEQVASHKLSKTVRVEDEDVAPPDWYQAQLTPQDEMAQPDAAAAPDETYEAYAVDAGPARSPAPLSKAPRNTLFSLDHGGVEITVPAAGVLSTILAGHELVVNGQVRPVPLAVAAGDVVLARAVDPQLIAARSAALEAARAAIPKPKLAYRDKTVRAPVPRKGPAPKDKTAGSQVYVRLAAPPAAPMPARDDLLASPLKVAAIPDGKPLPDDALGEDDVSDLAVDIGGGPSDADIEHARRMRDAETRTG